MRHGFPDQSQYRAVYLEAVWTENGETCIPVVRVLLFVYVRRHVERRVLLECTTAASLAGKRWTFNIQSDDAVNTRRG